MSCRDSRENTNTSRVDTVLIHDTVAAARQPADAVDALPAPQNEGDRLIVQGKRIGKAELGMTADAVGQVFGQPDESDAAMGKAWLTWFGKKPDDHNNRTELNMYTAYKDSNMNEKVVKQIRTTSSWFVTDDGIHVYSSWSDIRKLYRYAFRVGSYRQEDGRTITIYDDRKTGIAFEVAAVGKQNICVGIIIHPWGESVQDIYITRQPGLK